MLSQLRVPKGDSSTVFKGLSYSSHMGGLNSEVPLYAVTFPGIPVGFSVTLVDFGTLCDFSQQGDPVPGHNPH